MRSFLILGFLSLLAVLVAPFRFVAAAFALSFPSPRPSRDHLALLPRTPRSIFATRRMGLA